MGQLLVFMFIYVIKAKLIAITITLGRSQLLNYYLPISTNEQPQKSDGWGRPRTRLCS